MGTHVEKPYNLISKLAAEFVGTLFFIFIGSLSALKSDSSNVITHGNHTTCILKFSTFWFSCFCSWLDHICVSELTRTHQWRSFQSGRDIGCRFVRKNASLSSAPILDCTIFGRPCWCLPCSGMFSVFLVFDVNWFNNCV